MPTIVIEGNDIYDLGGGGIVGGAIRNRDTWQWADPLLPGEQKGYRIANNHVHDCGMDYFGAIGIFLGQTQEADRGPQLDPRRRLRGHRAQRKRGARAAVCQEQHGRIQPHP